MGWLSKTLGSESPGGQFYGAIMECAGTINGAHQGSWSTGDLDEALQLNRSKVRELAELLTRAKGAKAVRKNISDAAWWWIKNEGWTRRQGDDFQSLMNEFCDPA